MMCSSYQIEWVTPRGCICDGTGGTLHKHVDIEQNSEMTAIAIAAKIIVESKKGSHTDHVEHYKGEKEQD